ncbi:hypothetical protein [Burkholderia sp. BCC0322]|uniref:hypothetical protein n=1 Tax=unclassified Burkholderia TaxID=2613784 RepID=UPI00158BAAC3|nr:hypothetical protein [Burkholderia sp. BCC0322]
MADLSDVQNVLAGQIASWLYPNGTGTPSAVGFDVRVGCGWPTTAVLDADLKSGSANVSIYATGIEQKTTRWQQGWQMQSNNAPTLTLSQSGQVVTVGGTNPTPYSQQNIAIFINQSPYTYAVQPSDAPATIATALATIIAAAVPGTTSSGAAITIPAGARIGALRVGGTGTAVKVIRTQRRLFQIVLWCSTDAQRVAIANCIDGQLSDMTRIAMPDGLFARVVYHDSPQQDLGEKARLFRRDLRYFVEFSTTKTEGVAQVIVFKTTVSDQFGNPITSFNA